MCLGQRIVSDEGGSCRLPSSCIVIARSPSGSCLDEPCNRSGRFQPEKTAPPSESPVPSPGYYRALACLPLAWSAHSHPRLVVQPVPAQRQRSEPEHCMRRPGWYPGIESGTGNAARTWPLPEGLLVTFQGLLLAGWRQPGASLPPAKSSWKRIFGFSVAGADWPRRLARA